VRRPGRSSARVLALAISGALLFVVGYFAGSRYASPPLQDVAAVVLETPPLLTAAGVDLRGDWHLLAVGDLGQASCRDLLARLVRVHNRLAAEPDVQARVKFIFLHGQPTGTAAHDAAAHQLVAVVDTAVAHSLARQLGLTGKQALDCRDAPLGLVDDEAMLRALLPPATEPGRTARDLSRLLEHFGG
jgi:hypothetical protein